MLYIHLTHIIISRKIMIQEYLQSKRIYLKRFSDHKKQSRKKRN